VTNLNDAFQDQHIEATPARESSVCVFLWIPKEIKAEVLEFIFNHWNADDIDTIKYGKMKGSLRVWWD